MESLTYPRIIFIQGRERVGKSIVANYIQTQYKFVQHATGTIPKALFALCHEIEPHELEIIKSTVREQLINFIESAKLFLGPDCWVRMALPGIERDLVAGHSLVISDLGFTAEYEAIITLATRLGVLNDPSQALRVKVRNSHVDQLYSQELKQTGTNHDQRDKLNLSPHVVFTSNYIDSDCTVMDTVELEGQVDRWFQSLKQAPSSELIIQEEV